MTRALIHHAPCLKLTAETPLSTENCSANMSGDFWEELLDIYAHRGCAMCGQYHDTYDRGHLDRAKPAVLGNVVPLCADCNEWLQDNELDAEVDENLICRPVLEDGR